MPAKNLKADRLLPLAFHVDYWNYIGWVDPYAQPRFSDRQRQHSTRRRASFVYTPQLLLNGQDYRRGIAYNASVPRGGATRGRHEPKSSDRARDFSR